MVVWTAAFNGTVKNHKTVKPLLYIGVANGMSVERVWTCRYLK